MRLKPIAIIIVFLVAIIALGLVFFGHGASPAANSGSGGIASLPQDRIPVPASKFFPGTGNDAFFDLNTAQGMVHIKNFFADPSVVAEDDVVIIKKTSDYWFTYDPSNMSFWIAISNSSFEVTRRVAENDFLATLGVTEQDACKLDVSEGIPYSATNRISGVFMPLSFCPPRAQ